MSKDSSGNPFKPCTVLAYSKKWMLENQKYDDTIICSESQSLLLSIDSLTPDIADIRADFDKLFSLDPVPHQHPWE